jgi:hypothetical protein
MMNVATGGLWRVWGCGSGSGGRARFSARPPPGLHRGWLLFGASPAPRIRPISKDEAEITGTGMESDSGDSPVELGG